MPTKPKILKASHNAPNNEVPVGGPVRIDITGQSRTNDNNRVINILALAFYRVGGVPFMEEIVNRQAPNAGGQTQFDDNFIYRPKFLGDHTIRVIAWNNKNAQKPENGADHIRAGLLRIRAK